MHRAVACSTGYMVPEASKDVVGVIARARRQTREEALAYLKTVWTSRAPELERRWVAMLGHFARHGEPGDSLGEWPRYESEQRS